MKIGKFIDDNVMFFVIMIAVIVSLAFFGSILFSFEVGDSLKPCYDKYGNKIQGLTCESTGMFETEKGRNTFATFFLSIMFIMFTLFAYYENKKYKRFAI